MFSSSVVLSLLLAQVARPALPPAPSLDTIDLSGRVVVLSVDDAYHAVFAYVYPLLKQYRMTATLAPILNYVTDMPVSYTPSDRFMSRTEVQEMIDSCRIEIASHSLSHPYLTRLDSARAWAEIRGSKEALESLFGVRVVTFVYPYGDVNQQVRRQVQRAGYSLGRAVRPGRPDLLKDPFRIPTLELRNTTRRDDVMAHVRRNELTVLLIHRIVPRPQVFTEWGSEDFRLLLDWLQRRRVRVATLAELHRESMRRKLTTELLDRLERAAGRRQLFEHVDIDATRTPHSR